MIHHMPPPVTGRVPVTALFSAPHNTLGDLRWFDSQCVWSGCLDATDRLLSGSMRNLYSDSLGCEVVYSSFDFRPTHAKAA